MSPQPFAQEQDRFSFSIFYFSLMLQMVFITLLLAFAFGSNEVSLLRSATDLQIMVKDFTRSDEAPQALMATIATQMSAPHAVELLKKSNLTRDALSLITDIAKHTQPRRQPKGYARLDRVHKMLKYDGEIAKCTDFDSKLCVAREACRRQISASNYIAANPCTLILDSQAMDIPAIQYELKVHNLKCKNELEKINDPLKTVVEDIAVMTIILTMTDCDAKKKTLLQTENFALMACEDKCTHKSFITSTNGELTKQLGQLQSLVSHILLDEQTADLLNGIAFLQQFSTS